MAVVLSLALPFTCDLRARFLSIEPRSPLLPPFSSRPPRTLSPLAVPDVAVACSPPPRVTEKKKGREITNGVPALVGILMARKQRLRLCRQEAGRGKGFRSANERKA